MPNHLNLASLLTESEIKSLRKDQLQEYLRLRKKPTSGLKPELVERVLLYCYEAADEINNTDKETEQEEPGSNQFDDHSLDWKDLSALNKSEISSRVFNCNNHQLSILIFWIICHPG